VRAVQVTMGGDARHTDKAIERQEDRGEGVRASLIRSKKTQTPVAHTDDREGSGVGECREYRTERESDIERGGWRERERGPRIAIDA
jgi:hypothetical protein